MNSSNICRDFTALSLRKLFSALSQNSSSLSLALSLTLLLSGCGSAQDPAETYKGQSSHQIFQSGEAALQEGNYSTAVKHYEALDELYPFSSDSEHALLDSIYAYYQSGDYASSGASASRFIHNNPASPYVDYAWYMKGSAEMIQDRNWPQRYLPIDVSSRDPGMAKNAFNDFATLLQQFPNSKYAPDARQRMVYLRNLFAQKEVDIGQFYYDKKAYAACANRAAYVVEHYNSTPAEEKALYLMVQSYTQLNLPQESNKALQVLELNFPHSEYLKQIKK